MHVGHCQTGSSRSVRLKDRSPLYPQLRRFPTCIRRGAAPVWCNPRQRYEACKGYSCLERGRHPTEASKVVPNPRIAAGSTVVSYWLRLFRCTEDKKHHDDLKKSCSQLLTLEVIVTLWYVSCLQAQVQGVVVVCEDFF